MYNCPHCHAQIKKAAKFCPKCGQILKSEPEAEAKTCPGCQAALKPDQKFCTHCGQHITDEETASIEQAAAPVQEKQAVEQEAGQMLVQENEPAAPLLVTGEPSVIMQDNFQNGANKPEDSRSDAGAERPQAAVKKGTTPLLIALLAFIFLAGGTTVAWAFIQGYLFDSESPRVMITAPADKREIIIPPGEEASENIEIKATDNRRIKKVELYLNHEFIQEFAAKDIYTYKWRVDSPGEYVFHTFAYDYANNKSQADEITITAARVDVEQIAPGVTDAAGQVNEIHDAIYSHYAHIPDDLSTAYSYFSQKHMSRTPFGNWVKSFPYTIYDTVDDIKITYLSPGDAMVQIALTSKDAGDKGMFLVRKWTGQWKMVKEGSQWKLDEPQIKKTNEYYE